MKLSELYATNKDYDSSYEILIKTEKEFGDKIKRTLKDRVVYQRCRIKACSYSKDVSIVLNENNEKQKLWLKDALLLEHYIKK